MEVNTLKTKPAPTRSEQKRRQILEAECHPCFKGFSEWQRPVERIRSLQVNKFDGFPGVFHPFLP